MKKLRTSPSKKMMMTPKVGMRLMMTMMTPKAGIMGGLPLTRGLAMVQREPIQVTPAPVVAVTMKVDAHLLMGAFAKSS
jgi:hypothetical protein